MSIEKIVKPPIKTIANGNIFRAVFNEISFGDEKETGHEFIIRLLAYKLGTDWINEQRNMQTEERSIIYDWYEEFEKFKFKYSTEDNQVVGGWGSIPTGDAQSLLSLAYDVYCLAHVGNLPIPLIERLKNKKSYQGARYELAIASLFVKMDFELEFIYTKGKKHWEFTASHPTLEPEIAIEVKSRHRPGILKFGGKPQSLNDVKVGISRLLNEAISQKPSNIPFIIFIDLNLPLTNRVDYPDRKWFQDLKSSIDNIGIASPENPDPFTAIFITNFSYHYNKEIQINTGEFSQDGRTVISKYPYVGFRNKNTIELIMNGIRHMPDVPNNL